MRQPNEKQLRMLAERRIASVATVDADGVPHLTSVWFLYEDGCLYLAIPSSSAKGRNLARNPRIAVMIDVRSSYQEAGISASGDAEMLRGDEAAAFTRRVHEKYLSADALADPQVGPAFAAMDDIAVRLRPRKWIAWDMAALDAEVFGGVMAREHYLRDLVP
jgi:PPOX class probable F420-dependent enzyme